MLIVNGCTSRLLKIAIRVRLSPPVPLIAAGGVPVIAPAMTSPMTVAPGIGPPHLPDCGEVQPHLRLSGNDDGDDERTHGDARPRRQLES
ncbi:hypothetical protein [Micromonospora sp. LOL_024]|uniref:hypothetical protein n=1 Tax=Micromonospora sp. LOL_024 TaxID=3345412 RepID=UPI003A87E09A